jgi:hypothetical protein
LPSGIAVGASSTPGLNHPNFGAATYPPSENEEAARADLVATHHMVNMMEDFNSETDSDYTSYWRDWVG